MAAPARERRPLRADLGQLLRRPAAPASTSTTTLVERDAARSTSSTTARRGGDFLHAYGEPFADRFFFEIVQRADYDGYGAVNAPARMAAQEQAEPAQA